MVRYGIHIVSTNIKKQLIWVCATFRSDIKATRSDTKTSGRVMVQMMFHPHTTVHTQKRTDLETGAQTHTLT